MWCSGKRLSKLLSWPLTLAIKVSHITHYHSHSSVHQTLGLLPKTQRGSYQQNPSLPPHTQQLRLLTAKRSAHTGSHEAAALVSLACRVSRCPRGQFWVGGTSEPHWELRVSAFRWTYPERVSAREELLMWDGERDLWPEPHRSFCKCPLRHHHCEMELLESIRGKGLTANQRLMMQVRPCPPS